MAYEKTRVHQQNKTNELNVLGVGQEEPDEVSCVGTPSREMEDIRPNSASDESVDSDSSSLIASLTSSKGTAASNVVQMCMTRVSVLHFCIGIS